MLYSTVGYRLLPVDCVCGAHRDGKTNWWLPVNPQTGRAPLHIGMIDDVGKKIIDVRRF